MLGMGREIDEREQTKNKCSSFHATMLIWVGRSASPIKCALFFLHPHVHFSFVIPSSFFHFSLPKVVSLERENGEADLLSYSMLNLRQARQVGRPKFITQRPK